MPKHLTLSNRYCIEEFLKLGYQTSQIANKIGYSERAIKKELNWHHIIVTIRGINEKQ
ncbi:hypothetical protein ACP8HZ_06825 [Francisella noatunensis]